MPWWNSPLPQLEPGVEKYIWFISKNKNSLFSEYNLSNDFKKYISYKKDSGTLDYILLPKKYYFNELVCLEEYLSDHNGLYIEIKNLT